MVIQVLVSTMNQRDTSIIKKMNLKSKAIIVNQCEINKMEEIDYNGNNVSFLSFAERGVGLSRNNALMRASSDICFIADDDLLMNDNYVETIKRSFHENPDADILIFNLNEKISKRFKITKKFKVNKFNYMRFGAARIAFKRKSIVKNGIMFNLCFGGGTKYSAGEDTLFLNSCLDKKLNIIAVPETIATLNNERDSTWFKGYNEKFFVDRGALFAAVSKKWALLLCLQYVIRRRRMFKDQMTWKQALKLMINGIKDYRNY